MGLESKFEESLSKWSLARRLNKIKSQIKKKNKIHAKKFHLNRKQASERYNKINHVINNMQKNSTDEEIVRYAEIIERFAETLSVQNIYVSLATSVCNERKLLNEILELYDSDNLFKIKNSYDDVQVLDRIFGRLNNSYYYNTEIDKDTKLVEIVSLDEVIKTLNALNDLDLTRAILDVVENTSDKDLSIRTAQLCYKYRNSNLRVSLGRSIEALSGFKYLKEDKKRLLNASINVLNKYFRTGHESDINRCIWAQRNCEIPKQLIYGLEELNEEETFQKILKSADPYKLINSFLTKPYSTLQWAITNKDVRARISTTDLARVSRAYKVTMNLHDNKSQDQISQLEDGFYRIMNEKIASKDSLKDKLDILKRWSSEVYKSITLNSDNLKYVRNG
jgi:hypothetical protein